MARFCQVSERLVTAVCQWNVPLSAVGTMYFGKSTGCTPKKLKVKWSRYRPGVAQRVGRGIALLFHDRGTRRGWVFSSTPRPHFNPRKDQVPILQEAGWTPGPVWTDGKSRPHRNSIPEHPAHSQSLYWQSYPAHTGYTPIIVYIIWKDPWYSLTGPFTNSSAVFTFQRRKL